MATKISSTLTALILAAVLLSAAAADNHRFSRTLFRSSLKLNREKLSHLRFYFQDVVSGPHPKAVLIAAAPTTNTSATGFGALVMVDDPLTVGPDPRSRPVGRAQGMYGEGSQSEFALLMVMNLVFTDGKYNGSNLSLLGRNPMFNAVREMPIVGGSGLFQFAHGYANARTHTFNVKTGDATVEYNVYVLHYLRLSYYE